MTTYGVDAGKGLTCFVIQKSSQRLGQTNNDCLKTKVIACDQSRQLRQHNESMRTGDSC